MVEDFCEALNEYLQREFNYKSPPARVVWGNTIDARRVKFVLYLRYRPSNADSLIIAAIEFDEIKKGHATRLLKFICDLAPDHGFKNIILESVNDNGKAFGKKLGFTDSKNSNMIINIKELVRHLNKRLGTPAKITVFI